MALSDILEKILAEAETEVASILSKAEADVRKVEQETETRMTAVKKETTGETKRRQESMERKIHAHIKMEKKTGEIGMRTEVLEQVQKNALAKIRKLPDQVHVTILKGLLEKISEQGVVHPAKGQKSLVEKAVKASGKTFQVSTEEDISGGFYFVGEKVDIDCSYEAILEKEIFPKIETEFLKSLFSSSKTSPA